MYRQICLQIGSQIRSSVRLASGPPICSLPGNVTTPKKFVEFAQATSTFIMGDLRNAVRSVPPGPRVAYLLDVMSDRICQVADASEALRSLHSDSHWAETSHDIRIMYERLIADLNSDTGLASAVRMSLHGEHVDPDTLRVLQLLDREFASVHLPPADRERFVTLHHEASRLVGAFRQAVGSGSASVERTPSAVQMSANDILLRLLAARHGIAQTLGFKCYADLEFTHRVVKSPAQGLQFVNYLSQFMRGTRMDAQAVLNDARKEWSSLGLRSIGSYFCLRDLLPAIFQLVRILYGVQFDPAPLADGEGWAPQIVKYIVTDKHTNTRLGTVYLDLLRRPEKFPGCATFTLLAGRQLQPALEPSPVLQQQQAQQQQQREHITPSGYRTPVLAMSMHFSSLDERLELQDAETLLHEFGHIMHCVLSRTRYQHVWGNRGPLDFMEVPSTLMENFLCHPKSLALLAKQSDTGAPLPPAAAQVLKKMHLGNILESVPRLAALSAFDLQIHSGFPPTKPLTQLYQEAARAHTGQPFPDGEAYTQWVHLGDYAAGFYSYLFCRVTAAAVWRNTLEQDPLSPAAGLRLRNEMLSLGNSVDPAEMVARLLGRAPQPQDLFESLGLRV